MDNPHKELQHKSTQSNNIFTSCFHGDPQKTIWFISSVFSSIPVPPAFLIINVFLECHYTFPEASISVSTVAESKYQ